MIQHHLVYHFTSLDDGRTYYEANRQAAYYLVRSGKILQLVENRLGAYAAQVLQTIMYLGHASIAQLETLPELQPKQHISNGVNHDGENDEGHVSENGDHQENGATNGDNAVNEKPRRLHPTLKGLASHGYLYKVREAHFQSPNDNYLDALRIISSRSDIKQMKGKQQKAEIEEKTNEMIKARTEGDLSQGLMFNGLPQGVKRKRDNQNPGSHKESNGTNGVNGHHDMDEEEDEEGNDWSEDEDGIDSIPMDVSSTPTSAAKYHHNLSTP